MTENIKMEIDGAVVPLSGIWVHTQTDPFPGGHRYALRIPKQLADEWLTSHRLTWDDLRDAGLWFQSLFGDLAGSARYAVPLTHVLNTIDKIEVAEEFVVIYGVCSPFLRSKAPSGEPPSRLHGT
jgi:hypothetical protein